MTFPDTWHDSWSQIDKTADPAFFVECLNATRKRLVRAAHANPARFFAYLNIKPGDHVLEVGCGAGDMLVALADLVGPNGRVVGIDSSRTMIAEATLRAKRAGAPVEFVLGDAQCLDSPDAQFDHCLANSVLQHVDAPERALAEMVRVARPNGRITVEEPDWDAQIVDCGDIEVTRRIIHFFCDSIKHGAIARRLPVLMRDAGLSDVEVVGLTTTSTDPSEPAGVWLCESAERAAAAGKVSATEAEQWLAEIAERGRSGRFFAAFTTLRVSARKPDAGASRPGSEQVVTHDA